MIDRLRAATCAAVVFALALCGCGSLGLQLGRDKSDAPLLVYSQRLVELYGEQGALLRLVATGMRPERAARLLLDAQAARGPAAPTAPPVPRPTPEPFDGESR